LFEETPLEISRKIQSYAQADKSNIESGIYTPAEARSRYDGDGFNPTITLDPNTKMENEMKILEEIKKLESDESFLKESVIKILQEKLHLAR
jgi:hypothetical protein